MAAVRTTTTLLNIHPSVTSVIRDTGPLRRKIIRSSAAFYFPRHILIN
jgi:hypothetical protein